MSNFNPTFKTQVSNILIDSILSSPKFSMVARMNTLLSKNNVANHLPATRNVEVLYQGRTFTNYTGSDRKNFVKLHPSLHLDMDILIQEMDAFIDEESAIRAYVRRILNECLVPGDINVLVPKKWLEMCAESIGSEVLNLPAEISIKKKIDFEQKNYSSYLLVKERILKNLLIK